MQVKSLIIGANDEGQRLDRFLSKAFPDISHGAVRKALRQKDIKVNKKRAAADYRLAAGDRLEIYMNGLEQRVRTLTATQPLAAGDIIYEDDNIILVNKEAGLNVHEDREKSPDTLINRILAYLVEKGEYDPAREQSFCPALCNRIDRNTTGIVIAAKNAEALRIMSEKLKNRELKKLYLCLAVGKMPKSGDTLTAFLEKNEAENRVYIAEKKTNKNLTIKTAYKVIEYDAERDLSLLEVDLLTGRTHQIRAHLAYIGHPLLGDPKYGNNAVNRKNKCKKQALCSYKLIFKFTKDGGILNYLDNKEFEVKNIPFVPKKG